MSSVGIDFVLRARTTMFTQGLASANNSIKDLKKSLREFDVGGGIKQALGVGGVIAGFRLAIKNAQDLRDAAKESGRAIDDSTRSVAEFGDTLGKAYNGAVNLLTTTLSYFTRAGEGFGMLINRMRGVSAEQEKIREAAARGADEQEEAYRKKLKAAEERAKTIDKDITEQDKKNADIGLTDEQKRNKLLEERTKLLNEIDTMPEYEGDGSGAYNVARKEKILQAKRLTGQISELGESIYKESSEKQKEEDQKRAEAKKSLIEKFAPTVEQLAKQETGGFVEGNDPRLRARQALKEEDKARMLFERGDYKGGLAAAQKAQGIRKGLEQQTSESGVLTPKAAEDAFTNALKGTNEEIEDLKKAVQGIIKAQK